MNNSEILVHPPRLTRAILLLLCGLGWLVFSLFAITARVRANEPRDLFDFWIPSALASFVLCLASAVWWKLELARRRWLTIRADGFTLRHRDVLTYVTDDQVLSTSSIWKHFRFDGAHWSSTRTHNLWIARSADEHEKISLICKIEPQGADPLASLMERLNGKLSTRAKTEFEGGQTVQGEGWALDRRILRITSNRGAPAEIAVDQLEEFDVIDEELCIWSEGREEAVAKIPLQAANAEILHALIADALRSRNTEKAIPESGRLGRMIFERKPTYKDYVIYVALGIIFVGIVSPFVFVNGPNLNTYFMVFGLVSVGLLFFAGAYNTKVTFFRYHAFGVHSKGVLSDRKLRFADLEALTFSLVQKYVNGVYVGLFYNITFDPVPEQRSDQVVYQVRRRVADSELEKLRNDVSILLGTRMIARVNQGEKVPWTKSTSLHPEGLEFEPASLLLQRQKILLPYREIAYYDFRNGIFHLFSYKESSPVLKISSCERNFFPGFLALENLRPRLEFHG